MSDIDGLKQELQKYTNFYWSLFHKTNDDCSYYKDIINEKDLEIIRLKRELSV